MDIIVLNDDKSIINDNSYIVNVDTSIYFPDSFEYNGFSIPCFFYNGILLVLNNIRIYSPALSFLNRSSSLYFYRGLYFHFDTVSSDSSGGYFLSAFPTSLTSLASSNVGKYIVYSYKDFGRDVDIHYITDSIEELYRFIFDYAIEHSIFLYWLCLSSIEDSGRVNSSYRYIYNYVSAQTLVLIQIPSSCCFPDFAPIVKALGGFPVTDQPTNLKMICNLLGIFINSTLSSCETMKEYLRRIVQILGGSPLTEPNDNLKSICQLLGIDSNENGLTDCELSKDYVKRISKMLGAE